MEFFLHAAIGIKSLEIPELSLWYLCRGLDPEGSGWADVKKDDLAQFGKHRCTLWRWLNNNTLFRSYTKIEGGYRVFYRSLVRVCSALGVSQLGGIAHTDEVSNLAKQAALIQAQRLQDQSRWLAIHGRGAEHTKDMPQAFDFFDNDGTNKSWHIGSRGTVGGIVGKSILFAGRPVVKLEAESFFGGSQNGIAKRLGVCRQTVGKLLRESAKVRIVLDSSWWHWHRARFEQSENLGQPTETGFMWLRKGERNYYPKKLNPYIYYPLFELKSQKTLRNIVSGMAGVGEYLRTRPEHKATQL